MTVIPGRIVNHPEYGLCIALDAPDTDGVVQLVQIDGLPSVRVFAAEAEADEVTEPAQPAPDTTTPAEPAPSTTSPAATAEPAQPAPSA